MLVSLLLFPSCSARKNSPLSLEPFTAAPGDDNVPVRSVLVATNRKRDDSPGAYFGDDRSAQLDFAAYEIAIPREHKKGELEKPRRGTPNPDRHFAARDSGYLAGRKAFQAALRENLRTHPQKEVALYVHGFNTHFSDGVYSIAQLAHDADFDGPAVLFSWPSGGRLAKYIYDRESVVASRDALEETIQLIADAGAEQIAIVAHSLGCMLTMETLRQLNIAGNPDLGGRIRTVLLASPDISLDVFKSQLSRMGSKPALIVIISEDDRALRFSEWISGKEERVGNYADDRELAELGVVVIDMTGVSSDGRNQHSKFSEVPTVLEKVANHIEQGYSFGGRQEGRATRTATIREKPSEEVRITAPFRSFGTALDALGAR